MATLCNRTGRYIFAPWFLLSICLSFFLAFFPFRADKTSSAFFSKYENNELTSSALRSSAGFEKFTSFRVLAFNYRVHIVGVSCRVRYTELFLTFQEYRHSTRVPVHFDD